MQKGVHALGPLLSSSYGIETQNSEEEASINYEEFLGEMQVQHGKQSVFYVRFIFFLLHLWDHPG